jgi:uncharacterized protein
MEIKNYKDQNLENILEKIIPEFNPKKVILFGSRANGSHSENSDYDLFFIIEKSDLTRIERNQKARQLTWRLGHSIDYFFYTQDEFDSWKDEINSIPHSAATTGLELQFV